MKHTASGRFWRCFDSLPVTIQDIARQNFELLKINAAHPSLHFKPLGGGRLHSVRVGLHYRALGSPTADGVHWFWIGTHSEYDKLIS